jgi:thymidylate kinase
MLITLSGLDGAGKSTLIEWLRSDLERQKRGVTVLHLNDHVGVYAFARAVRDRLAGGRDAATVRHLAGRHVRRNRPGRFNRIRDAMVWSVAVRALIYPIDLVIFLAYRCYVEAIRGRILIMDRYFYDTLVDLSRGGTWRCLRLLARITPTPDVPVLLEITPEKAYARKGEYNVDYLSRRWRAYHRVFPWVRSSITLPSDQLEAARHDLERVVQGRFAA